MRKALLDRGRGDLIGEGRECLIPGRPPPEALEARRGGAQTEPSHVHSKEAGTSETVGYRPHRRGARRRGGGSQRRRGGDNRRG